MLQTTVASVNSALQRARAAVADRVPAHTQQATLGASATVVFASWSTGTWTRGNAATSTRSPPCWSATPRSRCLR